MTLLYVQARKLFSAIRRARVKWRKSKYYIRCDGFFTANVLHYVSYGKTFTSALSLCVNCTVIFISVTDKNDKAEVKTFQRLFFVSWAFMTNLYIFTIALANYRLIMVSLTRHLNWLNYTRCSIIPGHKTLLFGRIRRCEEGNFFANNIFRC
jgi:hypothetical protein